MTKTTHLSDEPQKRGIRISGASCSGERGKLIFIGKTWKTIENLSNVLFVEMSLIVKIRPIL
jgi:hypothetical protein